MRIILCFCLLLATPVAAIRASTISVEYHSYTFRIRTKGGGIVGGVLIRATDPFQAQSKLMVRYPGCTILRMDTD
jgi:hypothetical protein